MKTDKEMFINVSAGGTRIAVTENRKLVELHIERADYERMVGTICLVDTSDAADDMQCVDLGGSCSA